MTSLVVKIVPRSGRFDDGSAPVTVTRPVSRSPGRTGAVHRSSSTPGEPMDAASSRIERTNMPMKIAAVCQPLATRPPNGPAAAASSSTWNGCGSYRCANFHDLLPRDLNLAELGRLADAEVLPVAHDGGTYTLG